MGMPMGMQVSTAGMMPSQISPMSLVKPPFNGNGNSHAMPMPPSKFFFKNSDLVQELNTPEMIMSLGFCGFEENSVNSPNFGQFPFVLIL